MHHQAEPYGEVKMVRCTSGAVYDVIVDVRSTSPTFKQWFGVELSAKNRRQLYIPTGFAHGFQTLTDDAELFYQMSTPYVADAARGFRWNDPGVAIVWPSATSRVISERDQRLPEFLS